MWGHMYMPELSKCFNVRGKTAAKEVQLGQLKHTSLKVQPCLPNSQEEDRRQLVDSPQ